MKKFLILLITLSILIGSTHCIPLTAKASAETPIPVIELLENGYYLETFIEDDNSQSQINPAASTQTITKTKTTQLKNSAGTVLWSVSIKATFSYNGTTSTCTSCTPSAKAYASTWEIKRVTGSRNGNSATATAVATQTHVTGITEDYTTSVTIKCSATGVVS